MRPRTLISAAIVLATALLSGFGASPDSSKVRVYSHEGAIYGIPAMLLERTLDRASAEDVDLLLIELNTPGGEVTAMRDMVEQLLNSDVPVCVYVTPKGAWAASAGFFLLMAADVAAMAPTTTTGAASPVTMGGENKGDDVLYKKASQDAAALIRSAAKLRGRPPEIAESAVLEATSWSSEEALELGLIDLIANDRDALLAALDGREIIRGDGTKVVLRLPDPQVEMQQLDWAEEFQKFLFHPGVLLLLSSLAIIGIYIEFTNPGLILPGVVGVICLLIVFYGSQWLPLNFFALALIVIGLLLFFLEIKVISYGLLSIGGTVCLGVGLYLLFPRSIPGLAVPLEALIPVIVFVIGCVATVTFFVWRTMRSRVTTGREGVVGLVGSATTDVDRQGTVFVRGEYWNARSRAPIPRGADIRVVGAEGLLLEVERLAAEPQAGGARED